MMNSGLCETTQGLKWICFSEEDSSMAFAVLCFKNVHTPPPRGGADFLEKRMVFCRTNILKANNSSPLRDYRTYIRKNAHRIEKRYTKPI